MVPAKEWERVKGWIENALLHSGSTHKIEDVVAAIEDNRALLLTGKHSAIVCHVETFPECSQLRIWLVGGDKHIGLSELIKAKTQIFDFAQQNGCKRIVTECREGWARVLLGNYDKKRVILVKEI